MTINWQNQESYSYARQIAYNGSFTIDVTHELGGVNLKHGITSPPYLLHAFPFTVSLRSKLSFHDGALQAISIEQNIAEVGIETIV